VLRDLTPAARSELVEHLRIWKEAGGNVIALRDKFARSVRLLKTQPLMGVSVPGSIYRYHTTATDYVIVYVPEPFKILSFLHCPPDLVEAMEQRLGRR
jgi:hypothetical protein